MKEQLPTGIGGYMYQCYREYWPINDIEEKYVFVRFTMMIFHKCYSSRVAAKVIHLFSYERYQQLASTSSGYDDIVYPLVQRMVEYRKLTHEHLYLQ